MEQITILTVGEYPSVSGLHGSQVLAYGEFLKARGHDVEWLAFVPPEVFVRDAFSQFRTLRATKNAATASGLSFRFVVFPLTIVWIYSYLFRMPLTALAGWLLAKLLQSPSHFTGVRHILHCRSYFAADVALKAKKRLPNLHISFDMRSLLSVEIPLLFPKVGKYLYGGIKLWEAELLADADIAFLQCRNGIRLLESEGVEQLPTYVPIAGFSESCFPRKTTNPVLQKAVFAYVGGFGPWQSAEVLQLVYDELVNNMAGAKLEVISAGSSTFHGNVVVQSLPNSQVPQILTKALAVVIPGEDGSRDVFRAIQRHSSLFSTKAVEALSLGLPLIVNAKIRELADYVREKKCGIVFSVRDKSIRFEDITSENLSNESFWLSLQEGARRCAPTFWREHVFSCYLNYW